MNSELERVADTLFGHEHPSIGNVKFFRGHSRDVTADQLAEQLDRANSQIAAGEAHLVTNIDAERVN